MYRAPYSAHWEGQRLGLGHPAGGGPGQIDPRRALYASGAPGGRGPFIERIDGNGALFSPLQEGPLPEHYEPMESPVKNPLSKVQVNPAGKISDTQVPAHDWQAQAPAGAGMGDKMGGLGQFCVLLDDPEACKLPRNPTYTVARAWQEIVQPAAELSFVAGVEDVAVAYVIARRNIRMEDVE